LPFFIEIISNKVLTYYQIAFVSLLLLCLCAADAAEGNSVSTTLYRKPLWKYWLFYRYVFEAFYQYLKNKWNFNTLWFRITIRSKVLISP